MLVLFAGYKQFKGQVLHSKELEDIISGLRVNDLLHYSHILTGSYDHSTNLSVEDS